MNDDFPTFDRPHKTTSGKLSLGRSFNLKADFIKRMSFIIIKKSTRNNPAALF